MKADTQPSYEQYTCCPNFRNFSIPDFSVHEVLLRVIRDSNADEYNLNDMDGMGVLWQRCTAK